MVYGKKYFDEMGMDVTVEVIGLIEEAVKSIPPKGKKRILSMYWDSDTEECVIVTE